MREEGLSHCKGVNRLDEKQLSNDMIKKLLNVGANSLRRRNFGVMLNKVKIRIQERDLKQLQQGNLSWCKTHALSAEPFLKSLDSALWEETLNTCGTIEEQAQKKLAVIGLDLGGGGHYPLLYFLTRYLKPSTVMETGVAAGWSSQAILTALKRNGGKGHLYSSDFPYFRYENPERFIGYVVDDSLRVRWDLHIDGDRNNFPLILSKVDHIDLFHYDSDKSYAGRAYALEAVKAKLAPQAAIVFDDIQDNPHFKDFVEKDSLPFRVFEFKGKYLGLTAKFLNSV
jgi:predicted O-methyltransferase YrrM